MAARAIGSGTIAFGLVSIPVKLYTSSASSNEIRFNQIHGECGSRIRQKLYCPTHDRIVERDELVKGYEFSKGKYVTFTGEELRAVEEQSTGGIDIVEFVPLADVDPIYFDKAYFLGPEAGATRAYRLLKAAMEETGLSAVGAYAARGKQYLVLLRPVPDGIVLQQLHHDYELRTFDEVPMDEADVKPDELHLAIQLIRQGAVDRFSPAKYTDEVRARIEGLIEKKIAGEDITALPSETPKAQVIDLMEALKASLGESDAASTATDEAPSAAQGED
jgi:DNA end-binding protein Ku